jgi:hypothetical protein
MYAHSSFPPVNKQQFFENITEKERKGKGKGKGKMAQGFKSKRTTTTAKNTRHKAQSVKKGG